MKEHRSASQILFGFLPEQTVDLKGKVWKVKHWVEPKPKSVESSSLKQELERQVGPWAAAGKDGDYLKHLKSGYTVRLCSLNRDSGISVEKFPQSWVCKACDRLYQNHEPNTCQCGNTKFGQLPFVGFHDECGAIQTPYVKPCPNHKQVRIVLPGSARAEEIRFVCPVCSKILQKGFGYRACGCGKGQMTFNVHRAASVYVPRTLAMINPPSTEKVQRIRNAGGPSRALSWVLNGLKASSFDQLELTEESFRANLLAQGIPATFVDQMVEQAIQAGVISPDDTPINLTGEHSRNAETGAVNIALALADSRLRIKDLIDATDSKSELSNKYKSQYPQSLDKMGLETIELLDSFPVLTGCYGYTRGCHDAGASRLVPFKNSRGDYVVYGEVVETEALFVRMKPNLVADWLVRTGCLLDRWSDDKSARLSILRSVLIPEPGEERDFADPGAKLLTLIHSYAHWFTRQLAVHSGVERSALSEFLVPQHCAFFVYTASRGDFVLGGLQAVFESDLNNFLNELAASDLRCPLDPGCQKAGGACMACLHLGEPSCRYYNRYLSRSSLMRRDGYLLLNQRAQK
jgi:hypothetical protein